MPKDDTKPTPAPAHTVQEGSTESIHAGVGQDRDTDSRTGQTEVRPGGPDGRHRGEQGTRDNFGSSKVVDEAGPGGRTRS